MAAKDDDVESIIMHIDSPGGSVPGTAELANDVGKVNKEKPVTAHIDDLGASAAYWVASQAGRIVANATAEVGSIGTYAVITDSSGKAAAEGIRVHVISTGEKKGIGVPGTAMDESGLAYIRERVEALNAHFLLAVQGGRQLSDKRMSDLSDGRVVIASEAKKLGLIDGIQSLDDTLASLIPKKASTRNRAKATLKLLDIRASML